MNNQKTRYSAFDTAVYYLTFKDRTKKEITDKLTEKGYGMDEIDAAIDKLSGYGYIDDEGYALSYIKSKQGKMGRRLISLKLSQKGIEKETIERLLGETDNDECSDIKRILKSRYGDLSDISTRRKASGYFARRGYSFDEISDAINTIIFEQKDY